MESKAVLPLPPGMVPSSSREDMSALKDLELKEEEREDSVLKKVCVAQLHWSGYTSEKIILGNIWT